jgi:hypothetical protein
MDLGTRWSWVPWEATSPSALGVLRGLGDGRFDAAIPFSITTGITHIHADADYNGDDVNDIVLTHGTMGRISILESNP